VIKEKPNLQSKISSLQKSQPWASFKKASQESTPQTLNYKTPDAYKMKSLRMDASPNYQQQNSFTIPS